MLENSIVFSNVTVVNKHTEYIRNTEVTKKTTSTENASKTIKSQIKVDKKMSEPNQINE